MNPAYAKILILSASVGAGHVRAAKAVELALRQVAPHAALRSIDVVQKILAMSRPDAGIERKRSRG
jgi:UDP-N-acetylglucosamine:LPS N-acetylglucosamine transferase